MAEKCSRKYREKDKCAIPKKVFNSDYKDNIQKQCIKWKKENIHMY